MNRTFGWLRTTFTYALMALGVFLTVGRAVADDSHFEYDDDGVSATITGYTGPGGDVIIPNELNGRPVTKIGTFAFYSCASLTSVTIPSSVTTIDDAPFVGCTSLTTIVVELGNPAYSSVGGVLFNKALTTLVECPGGKSAAYTISASVTSIGRYAFAYCIHLTGVTIPSTVTTIGEGAFEHCDSVADLTIPAGVTTIENHTFAGCHSLDTIRFKGNAPILSGDMAFWLSTATVYRLAGASGWGATFGDRPVEIWSDSEADERHFTWDEIDGNAVIMFYNGPGGDVTIPNKLGGFPVIRSANLRFCIMTL